MTCGSMTALLSALAGVAAGEPGPRPRVGAGALALRAFGRRRRGRRLRGLLVVGEDLRGGRAVEQGDELLGVDGLALEQQLGDLLELVAALVERAPGGLVGALDDAADLVVDLAGDL